MASNYRKKSCGKKQVDDSEENSHHVKGSSSAHVTEISSKDMDFSRLLEGVVFALSGFVNPERATLRSQALEMGAEYQPDWTSLCTILVCAFPNTPKFRQVKADGDTIVSKDWISECYSQKRLIDIEPHLMHVGKPWRKISKQCENKQDKNNFQSEEPLQQVERSHVKSIVSHLHESGFPTTMKDQFSPSNIKEWAVNDLKQTMAWLESQDEKPEKNEIKPIAAEGIFICLQDAIESLREKKDIRHVMEQWMFVPRVVKELAELEGEKSGKGLPSKKELFNLAVRCKEIYEQEFGNLCNSQTKKQKTNDTEEGIGGMEINVEDAGFDSDETIEMTEEEIDLCLQRSF